jgi:hypothetical protein
MKSLLLAVAASALLVSSAPAQTTHLKPAIQPIGFLLGKWTSDNGVLADTGGRSTGTSTVTAETGGATLLRRDHTSLFDANGRSAGGFDQLMMIYPEGGALHADYSDGTHIVHYRTAVVDPGKSVVFTSEAPPGEPTYRLAYAVTGPMGLSVSFSIKPPGSDAFQPIATGGLIKVW